MSREMVAIELPTPVEQWNDILDDANEDLEEAEWYRFNVDRQLRAYNMHYAQRETSYVYRPSRAAQTEINLYHRENRQKHNCIYYFPQEK